MAAYTCTTSIRNDCLFRIKFSCKHIGIFNSILIPSNPNERMLPFGTTHLRMSVPLGRTETTIRPWHFTPEKPQHALKCLKIAYAANCTTPAAAGRCLLYFRVPKSPKTTPILNGPSGICPVCQIPVRPGWHSSLKQGISAGQYAQPTHDTGWSRENNFVWAALNNNLTLRGCFPLPLKRFIF